LKHPLRFARRRSDRLDASLEQSPIEWTGFGSFVVPEYNATSAEIKTRKGEAYLGAIGENANRFRAKEEMAGRRLDRKLG